ncbi:MAG: YdcF family protein [Syntrophobacterales bacterium]|nr:YdcF family protein [Syntrophobacterales bacterium]
MHSAEQNNPISRTRFFRIAALLVVLLALCDLAATFIYVRAGVSMVAEQSHASWEAAVVLFSDFGPYGGMDDESLRRLNFALDLYRSGHAPVIICSGGARPSRNLHSSAFMKRYLVERGIEEARVIEEGRSNHTLGNLNETRDFLRRMHVSRVVVVSSPIHLPRVKGLISRSDTAIFFDATAYDLQQCDPPIVWHTVYRQVHHEFAALLAGTFFSADLYESLIKLIRA